MMEFWGIDIKSGISEEVQPGEGKLVHLSQACFGEIKKEKGSEFARLYAEKDGQKLVIAILSPDNCPCISLDLVFEDSFALSHDWKHGSIHIVGYKVDDPSQSDDEDESGSDDDELVPLHGLDNGVESKPSGDKAIAGVSGVKPDKGEGKQKVKIVEPKEDEDDDSDDDDEDEETDEDEEIQGSGESEDEDDSDSDDAEDSDEETPKKPEPSKKRPGESSSKSIKTGKKAKLSTPEQKADGKKVTGHVATPHPAKQGAKTSASSDKSNKETPKSVGSVACSSCNRSFGSEQALLSHSKAKHGAK